MQNTVAALGTFDGVHLGHKAVLQAALEYSDLIPVCISFKSTPKNALGVETPLLLTDEQRIEKIKELGFKEVILLDFNEVRNQSPAEFLSGIIEKYNIAAICCGFNYRFGLGGAGDTALLSQYCEENKIRLTVSKEVKIKGITVSSTEIRRLIAEGEIGRANEMLGFPYFIEGNIVHGFKRGRTLGFPTINQDISNKLCSPKYGVYRSEVSVEGKRYRGLTNIGNNPTFSLPTVKAETYIHEFSGEIYGKHARVELLEFIRPEIRFSTAEQLKKQLQRDLKTII